MATKEETKAAPAAAAGPKTVAAAATSGTKLEITEASTAGAEKLSEKEETGGFKFVALEAEPFPLSKDREDRSYLLKWGLDTQCEFKKYRFDERFTADKVEAFVRDFFSSTEVQGSIRVASRRGEMHRGISGAVGSVRCRMVPTNLVRMDLFDRLQEEGLVSDTGRMRGCMPELYDGVESGTLVREMILNEDSEHFLVYDDDEKDEFLFRIFRHLVIGGGMCQPEENVNPYLEGTKKLYKSLMSVKKQAGTGKLEVTSQVIAVESVEGFNLFPSENDHNLCYLIVDPSRRKVTFWSNAHVSMW